MKSMADYSRQLSLQWMNESRQASIIQSRVLIFGAGGLAVAAVSYLAGAGVGTITLVDPDRIEASNLHRQTIFRMADIGQYKAKVAASYVSERNPNCAMSALTEFLDLQSLHELFEQHDLVLDCTDDQNFSRLLNALCLVTGKSAVFANAVKKVVGVEYVEEAIEDAKINAQLNDIENVSFFAGDMKDIFTEDFIAANGTPDLVVTDPPRAGMHADVVAQLAKLKPNRILYISCNPATQARDLALLDEKYEVTKIQPVDMFPHTLHIENVVQLKLKK